jgi:hypothetical protein
MSITTWQDTCSRCGQSRWWPSRLYNLKVGWWSSEGNPLLGLIVLAQRAGEAAVRRAEAWTADPTANISTSSKETSRPIETARGMP